MNSVCGLRGQRYTPMYSDFSSLRLPHLSFPNPFLFLFLLSSCLPLLRQHCASAPLFPSRNKHAIGSGGRTRDALCSRPTRASWTGASWSLPRREPPSAPPEPPSAPLEPSRLRPSWKPPSRLLEPPSAPPGASLGASWSLSSAPPGASLGARAPGGQSARGGAPRGVTRGRRGMRSAADTFFYEYSHLPPPSSSPSYIPYFPHLALFSLLLLLLLHHIFYIFPHLPLSFLLLLLHLHIFHHFLISSSNFSHFSSSSFSFTFIYSTYSLILPYFSSPSFSSFFTFIYSTLFSSPPKSPIFPPPPSSSPSYSPHIRPSSPIFPPPPPSSPSYIPRFPQFILQLLPFFLLLLLLLHLHIFHISPIFPYLSSSSSSFITIIHSTLSSIHPPTSPIFPPPPSSII
ncbi:hypothetical protein C7M84_020605 [Penaeus vannamei]|uniref:Uncharacterized protein n=1 Tax=Penaeus vannamei TaxID=6689 RepID=A0A3R7NLR5_PENVA|nr:hypothetical protein C7M84_020605 [Penaeus vannamei]